jgi:hypothetical protein
MKYIPQLLVSLVLMSNHSGIVCSDDFAIILEPQWKILHKNNNSAEQFGGKWILAGNIILKNKSRDCINLKKLHLQWHGKPVDNLIASLYQQNPDKQFYPIQDFLLSDGVWHKNQQTLIFNFEKTCLIGANNIFYLVLTVPTHLEAILQEGYFSLVETTLPHQFRALTTHHSPILSLNHTQVAQTTIPSKKLRTGHSKLSH